MVLETSEFDGETYGESHSYDEQTGDFNRNIRGQIGLIDGPWMVAEQLVRTLRTPIGDDPFRPDFGLDREQMLGQHPGPLRVKEAIIDCIGPEQFPWVEHLRPADIDLEFDAGNRIAAVEVYVELTDGTPVRFSMAFDALLAGADVGAIEDRAFAAGRAPPDESLSGFGRNFGNNFGE